MEESRNVLVIGAHQDECEFCCGGLTLFLIENGFRVFFLNTIGDSSYWSTVGPEKNAQSIKDAKEAAKILGAEKILLPYKNHEFISGDLKAMREIVKVVQEINPEIAMIHWINDRWYDHRCTAVNSFEALAQPNTFFETNFKSNLKEIYTYESGQYQTFNFYPDFYIDISDKMDKIIKSFSKFQSMGDGTIKGLEREKKALAHHRAVESQWYNVEYVEAYKFLKYRPNGISILPEMLGNKFKMANWPEATNEYCR